MKDKFEILNDVKINIDEYEEVKFDNNDEFKEKMVSKIKSKKRLNKKGIAVASVAVLAGSMFVMSEPSLAYIANLGKRIEYFFNRGDEEFSGYKVEIDKVISQNNIDIKLREIMLGDGELLLSLNIDDSKLDKDALGLKLNGSDSSLDLYEPKIQIGDMTFISTGGGYTSELNKDDNSIDMLLTCRLENVDINNDGEVDVENFDLTKNLDVNKNYDIKISIDRIGYTVDEDANVSKEVQVSETTGGGMNADTGKTFKTKTVNIPGNWNFEGTLNAKNIVDNIDIYEINKEINIKDKNIDVDITVDEIRISPSKVKIKYGFKTNKNEVKSLEDGMKIIDFIVKDENGKEVEVRGCVDLDAPEELRNPAPYAEGDLVFNLRDAKSIKIIPKIDDYSKKFAPAKLYKESTIELNLN